MVRKHYRPDWSQKLHFLIEFFIQKHMTISASTASKAGRLAPRFDPSARR